MQPSDELAKRQVYDLRRCKKPYSAREQHIVVALGVPNNRASACHLHIFGQLAQQAARRFVCQERRSFFELAATVVDHVRDPARQISAAPTPQVRQQK